MNENDVQALKNISPQLADIELPTAVEMWPWYAALLLILSIVATAARLAQIKRRKQSPYIKHTPLPAEVALQRLAELAHQDLSDRRAIAFRLATLLRLGMELQQLTEQPPADLAPALREQWLFVFKQLTTLRYQNNLPTQQTSLPFEQIETLLLSRVNLC